MSKLTVYPVAMVTSSRSPSENGSVISNESGKPSSGRHSPQNGMTQQKVTKEETRKRNGEKSPHQVPLQPLPCKHTHACTHMHTLVPTVCTPRASLSCPRRPGGSCEVLGDFCILLRVSFSSSSVKEGTLPEEKIFLEHSDACFGLFLILG